MGFFFMFAHIKCGGGRTLGINTHIQLHWLRKLVLSRGVAGSSSWCPHFVLYHHVFA